MNKAIKHPQHILACDKALFGDIAEGFSTLTPKEFFERVTQSLFIGRREELEKDERFGQILPYVVLWQRVGTGRMKVFVYQRTKKVGEQRLAGALSIGLGGHVDLQDVLMVDKSSVVDVVATMALTISRELNEECLFFRSNNAEDKLTYDELRAKFVDVNIVVFPKFCGVINDTSNEVGRVHFGFVFAQEIPPGFEPTCREEELSTVGMVDVDLAAGKGEGVMESWSQIVLANFEAVAA